MCKIHLENQKTSQIRFIIQFHYFFTNCLTYLHYKSYSYLRIFFEMHILILVTMFSVFFGLNFHRVVRQNLKLLTSFICRPNDCSGKDHCASDATRQSQSDSKRWMKLEENRNSGCNVTKNSGKQKRRLMRKLWGPF